MSVPFRFPDACAWRNPWPMYRALRDHDPVHHVVPTDGDADYYVLSRHADIRSAAWDHETFSPERAPGYPCGEPKPPSIPIGPVPPNREANARNAFSARLNRGFTASQMAAVTPRVRHFAIQRIERLRANGRGDIVAELLAPLPAMVVADYLGVPEQDRSHFYGWAEKVASANLGDGSEDRQPILAAFTTMTGYFIELMKLRRSVPGDDTISQILAAGIGGGDEASGMLSLLAFTFAIVAGGIDTTIGMLGGAVQLLHQRPDQRRLLARNPGGIPASIDEFLRLTSPVQMKTRVVTRDVMVGDTQIPAGRKVLLLYGSGNRDERQYGPDAGRLDVRRRPANILAFGHGATGCPGSALARMQAQVVLTELLTRCPDFEVDEANIVWANTSHVRRPLSLPFRIGS